MNGKVNKLCMLNKFTVLLAMLFVVVTVCGQARKITGTVTDDSGLPIQGATIKVNNSSQGTITDAQGAFVLDNLKESDIISVSYVGMDTKEISVKAKTMLNVQLTDKSVGLQEVVAIGYGTTSKRAVTGSVLKVKGENLGISNSTNVAAALQGKAAGVQITRNSGDPNADVNIRIRGNSSINSGGTPLVVVDGIPGGMSLNDINPADIESIEILKDASASAIYGARAANGVVLVTTKRGSKEKGGLTIDVQTGMSTPTKKLDIVSGADLMNIYDKAWLSRPENTGTPIFPEYGMDGFTRDIALTTNTDWSKIVQNEQANYTNIALQSVGGTDKLKLFLSGYYRNYNSLTAGSGNEKAQIRVGVEQELKKWLQLGATVTGTYLMSKNPNVSYTDAYTNLLSIYPTMSPSTDPLRTGKYFYDRNKTGNQGLNPLYKLAETWRDNQQAKALASSHIEVKPVEWLKIRSEWSLNYASMRLRDYQSKEFRRVEDSYAYQYSTSVPKVGVSGGINYGRYQTYNWNTSNYATFDKSFSKHRVNAVIGHSAEAYTYDGNNNQYEGFPSPYFTLTNANTELVATRQSVSYEQYRFLSYFTRAKYSYDDKYHAEISYRTDGSSRFGAKNRWGYFPGVSLAWTASEEKFMKELSWINFLKLRLSSGSVGNAEMGNYPYLSTLVNWAPYGSTAGFLFNSLGNDQIRWESQIQSNIGIDFTVLNNRLSGSVDYFIKNSNDLIVSNKIGTFQGYFVTDINVNLGQLTNKGFDVSLTSKNLTGAFKWTTDFNISTVNTKVRKLSPNQRFIDSGKNRVVENYPLGTYFLPLWAGVDPVTGHELVYAVNQGAASTNMATPDNLTGEVLDAERLTTAQYNNQRVLLKERSPYPTLYGGLTNTFSFKGIDMSFLFVFQGGNWIYDEGIQKMNYVSTTYNQNLSPELLNGWTAAKPTNVPMLWNTQMSSRASSRFLYDGSYIRLKNISLGYTFPKNICKALFVSSIKVYGTAENLLTFTKYPGADPEFFRATTSQGANIAPGIADITMPQVKTLSVGLQIGL